jgi:anaerobic magnesium-protoporphyrin IX monomethyl ester cyclase
MKIKVLLINAINPEVEIETRYPNLGLGYLVSALRNHFGKEAFDFKIIDRDVKNAIFAFRPSIICITSVSQNYNIAKRYADLAKEYNTPVIMGGVHISMLPESLTESMDIGCVGEGEETIVELLSILLNKGGFPKDNLSSVRGIVYKDGGNLKITSPRGQAGDLDKIAMPARDLYSINSHTYMFSSRGCLYDCIFCASAEFWQKARFFSAEYVVSEIEELVQRYNVKLISFFDDLFIGNLARLRKIAEILEGKDFLKKLRFTCSARANLVNDEVAKLLKRMRVASVGMGLESGSDKTLNYLKGGNISVADNSRAIAILNKYGIAANASFVIGSPQETKEEILKTYFFIKNNPLSLFDAYILTPYPGTHIWNWAKDKGIVSDDMDWARLNVNFNSNSKDSPILSQLLSRKELIQIYRKFRYLRLYKNIKNIWFTPQLFDLPGVIFKNIFGYASRIFKKGPWNKNALP